MISVVPHDRDVLCFLLVDDINKKLPKIVTEIYVCGIWCVVQPLPSKYHNQSSYGKVQKYPSTVCEDLYTINIIMLMKLLMMRLMMRLPLSSMGGRGITQAVEFILPRRHARVLAEVDSAILIICRDSAQICFILVGGSCSSILMELTVRLRNSMVWSEVSRLLCIHNEPQEF